MRGAGSRKNGYQADEENPYWISFSDIMAALLVIFVLASVALIVELMQKSEQWDQQIQEIAKAEEVRRDLLRDMEQELRRQNIPVTISDNDTVLRISEEVLSFEQGSYDLPTDTEHQRVAKAIGIVLYESITREKRWQHLDTVFVEGHTDKVPNLNSRIKGNWGLSSFRAISVWEFWNQIMERGSRLEDLQNHDGRKLFSVSGYAETRPVPETFEAPDSPENLKKNRRIDIRITVRRPSLEEFKAVKDLLK